MAFYPMDDDDDVFKPKSKSTTSSKQSTFKSSFDNDTPAISRDNSIKTETKKEEMGTRGSDSKLSDWRRDKQETRVTDRWNKHVEEKNKSPSSKPTSSWVRITAFSCVMIHKQISSDNIYSLDGSWYRTFICWLPS